MGGRGGQNPTIVVIIMHKNRCKWFFFQRFSLCSWIVSPDTLFLSCLRASSNVGGAPSGTFPCTTASTTRRDDKSARLGDWFSTTLFPISNDDDDDNINAASVQAFATKLLLEAIFTLLANNNDKTRLIGRCRRRERRETCNERIRS